MLNLFKKREFLCIWSSQAASRLGDGVYNTVVAWWIAVQTKSAIAVAITLVAFFLPNLIGSLINSAISDKIPRKSAMFWSDFIRMIIVGLLAIIAFLNVLQPIHVYVASFFLGLADAFFQPSYFAVMTEIVDDNDIAKANSITVMSTQISGIIGPLLGAILIGSVNIGLAMLINSLSFFASMMFLYYLKIDQKPSPKSQNSTMKNILAELGAGFSIVRSMPWLWVTIGVASVVNISLSGPMLVALPTLINKIFGEKSYVFGLIQTAMSIGALIAAAYMSRFGKLRHKGLWAYSAWVFAGIAEFGFGVTQSEWIMFLCAIVRGIGVTIFTIVWTSSLQEIITTENLGKVYSIDMMGSYTLLPVGYMLTGTIVGLIGESRTFIVGGLVTITLIIIGFLHPKVRKFD